KTTIVRRIAGGFGMRRPKSSAAISTTAIVPTARSGPSALNVGLSGRRAVATSSLSVVWLTLGSRDTTPDPGGLSKTSAARVVRPEREACGALCHDWQLAPAPDMDSVPQLGYPARTACGALIVAEV